MSKHVGTQQGFEGCIGQIILDGKKINFVKDALNSRNVSQCDKEAPCELGPCQNSGTCRESGDTFTCDCAPGYTGDTCDHVKTLCHTQDTCHNQGLCTGNTTHYTCHCPWGFEGTNCNSSMANIIILQTILQVDLQVYQLKSLSDSQETVILSILITSIKQTRSLRK